MSKIEEIMSEFADLNLQIIKDIKKRGYSHADVETLAEVRQNLEMLKSISVGIKPVAVEG